VIAKHVPMNSAKKSDFAGLVKYINDAQSKQERVRHVCITNCHSEQAEIAVLEVLNTQAQNKRSAADKTYHLIVSFRAGEFPDNTILKAIEERICAGLGFAVHQRIRVVHSDTDNLHMHIAINKIHPERHTIHEPFNAYHTLGKLCDKLENEYGLEKDNHKASKVGSENRADDMERHAAVESLIGWIKRECKAQMHEAASWKALHEVLQRHGLHIHERANGLVITTENGTSVKVSSVDRQFSKPHLETRLGRFETHVMPHSGDAPTKRYEKQPMHSNVDTAELYKRYKAARQTALSSRELAWDLARDRKSRSIEDAKRMGRLKRAAIKMLDAPRTAKRLMYFAASETLRNDIEKIHYKYLKERQEIHQQFQRLAWADWLKREATGGDLDALAVLRARQTGNRKIGNTVASAGPGKRMDPGAKPDSITKKGTFIYHVGSSAVRDDGDRLLVSQGSDQTALVAALHFAIERYGSRIAVNGSSDFKEQVAQAAVVANLFIKFDDGAIEHRRHELANTLINRESKHDIHNGSGGDALGRRPDHGSDAGGERAVTRARRFAQGAKPNARGASQTAPPETRHGMRDLSELGMVQLDHRPEVLLPRDVPGDVERQGAESDHRMRRPVHRTRLETEMPAPMSGGASRKPNVARIGYAPPPTSKDRLLPLSQLGAIAIGNSQQGPRTSSSALLSAHLTSPAADLRASKPVTGLSTPAIAAAEKYAIEREQKRRIGFDIPKHKPFTFTHPLLATYAGMRKIDGQHLALFKVGDEVMVLPVDHAMAQRLRRLSLGAKLSVSQGGAIKPKGRSR
jgi:hypothetical protein